MLEGNEQYLSGNKGNRIIYGRSFQIFQSSPYLLATYKIGPLKEVLSKDCHFKSSR